MRTNPMLPIFLVAFAVGCSDRLQVDDSTNGVTENDHARSGDDDAAESEPEATTEDDIATVDSGAEPSMASGSDDDADPAEPVPAPEASEDDADPEASEPEVSEVPASEPEAFEPAPPEPAPSAEDDDDIDVAPPEPAPEAPEPVSSVDAGSESTEVLECPFDETLTYDSGAAYPFCQWGELPNPIPLQPGQQPPEPLGWEKYCPQYESSWGFFNWHADGENSGLCANDESCNACNCSIQCDQDTPSGCPAGETGNATPTCFNSQPGIAVSGDCWLTCNDGETCPDGMQCVPMPEYQSMVCAWITEGDRCSDEQLYSSP